MYLEKTAFPLVKYDQKSIKVAVSLLYIINTYSNKVLKNVHTKPKTIFDVLLLRKKCLEITLYEFIFCVLPKN